jgi:hypothetical protein
MRAREIIETRPVKPLSPEQACKRAEKLRQAQARLADIKQTCTLKIRRENQRISAI